MTFEHFYAGRSYAYEVELAKKIAEHPGGEYSPLIIFGPCGTGKTHLLSAISARASENKYKTICASSDDFAKEMMVAVCKDEMDLFLSKYKTADILLLDNFELLAKKEQTQIEVFKLFDYFSKRNKQIVLCINGDSREHGFSEKIKARLRGGILLNIPFPDKETKSAIAYGIANEWNLALNSESKEYIIQKMTTAAEIKSVLKSIKIHLEIAHRYPSLEVITRLHSERI